MRSVLQVMTSCGVVRAMALVGAMGILSNGCAHREAGFDSLMAICGPRWRVVKLVEGDKAQTLTTDNILFRCDARGEVVGRAYINYFSAQAERDVDGAIKWRNYENTAVFASEDVVAKEADFRRLWLATNHVERQGDTVALVSFNGRVRLQLEPTRIPFEFEQKK